MILVQKEGGKNTERKIGKFHMRIQNPVKYVIWIFCKNKSSSLSAVNYF